MRPVTWWGKTLFLLCQIAFVIVILFPILYAVDVSFMPQSQLFKRPPNLMPTQLNFDNYALALENAPLFRFMLNSIIVATSVTAGQMILSSLRPLLSRIFNLREKIWYFMMILGHHDDSGRIHHHFKLYDHW